MTSGLTDDPKYAIKRSFWRKLDNMRTFGSEKSLVHEPTMDARYNTRPRQFICTCRQGFVR